MNTICVGDRPVNIYPASDLLASYGANKRTVSSVLGWLMLCQLSQRFDRERGVIPADLAIDVAGVGNVDRYAEIATGAGLIEPATVADGWPAWQIVRGCEPCPG